MNGHYEWHCIEIARMWSRDPDWLFSLPQREQMRLFAWYRIKLSGEAYQDPKKQRRARESPVNLSRGEAKKRRSAGSEEAKKRRSPRRTD